jgi:hypothetical protein
MLTFDIESNVPTDEEHTPSTHQAPLNKGKARAQENSPNEKPHFNLTDTRAVNSDFSALIAQGKFQDLRIQVFSQAALEVYGACKSFFLLIAIFFSFIQPSP